MKCREMIPIHLLFLTISTYHLSGVDSRYSPGRGRYSGMGRGMSSRDRVLGGSYGTDARPPPLNGMEDGSTSNSALDPNSLIPASAYSEMDALDLQKSEDLKLIDLPAGGSFVDIVVACAPIVKYCLLQSIGPACPLACLLDNTKEARHFIYVLKRVTRSLCSPIGSSLDLGVAILQDRKNNNQQTSLLQYLNIFGGGSNSSSPTQFTMQAADALPMVMIKYITSPVMDLLKPVIFLLSSEMIASKGALGNPGQFSNPKCQTADLTGSAERLVEQIVNTPYVMDVALGGWFVLSNIVSVKLESVELTDMMKSVFNMMLMMTGVECNLIKYAELGEATKCKPIVGTEWNLKKAAPGLQEVCGIIEDLPPIDLHQMFPTVFVNKVDMKEKIDNGDTDDNVDENLVSENEVTTAQPDE